MAPEVGLFIPEAIPAPEAVEMGVSLEAAGFEAAWFTEIDREPFVRSAAILARTERLKVGTGIALWSRSPVTMAMTAAELHEFSGGRFIFGIGTGTAYHNESFHNIEFERPARRMSEYMKVMRGVWDAYDEPFDFEGEIFTVKGFSQPYFETRPPLILAAVGPAMVRLAARQGDGVMMNPSTTPWYVETHVMPQLEAGAAQAGRSLDGFHRSICMRASVDSDRATARQRARHGIVEYGRYPVHQAQYKLYGFGQEAELIAAAAARGDTAAALAAVSEEMVDVLGLAGTPDEVRRALHEWDDVLDSAALMSPMFELTTDEVRANCEAVIEAFAS
jgi:alkanesulfonate monooxygenase SsuD/methylene tetrahydromethanopterin reductase-like flavin-dependent oxidoreductase (luciferase family)